MSTSNPRIRLSLGEELLELADRLRETFSAAVAVEGLTFSEGRLLRVAARCADQSELVRVLRIAPSQVSTIVTKLERRGLIARESAQGDRRHRRIEVTDAGRAALQRVFDRLDASSPLMTALTSADRATLRDLVTRVLSA